MNKETEELTTLWIDKEALVKSRKMAVTFVYREEHTDTFPVVLKDSYDDLKKQAEVLVGALKEISNFNDNLDGIVAFTMRQLTREALKQFNDGK
jgi:hypothetical protein